MILILLQFYYYKIIAYDKNIDDINEENKKVKVRKKNIFLYSIGSSMIYRIYK